MSAEVGYDEVEEALQRAGATVGAAECHGAVCGLACALDQPTEAVASSHAALGVEPGSPVLRGLVEPMIERAATQLADPAFGFEPLLPPDERSLAERADALGRWSQGFLAGLGLAGVQQDATLPDEVREVMQDLGEISRVQTDIEDDEEGETAYAELVEYLRTSAMLVDAALREGGGDGDDPEDEAS